MKISSLNKRFLFIFSMYFLSVSQAFSIHNQGIEEGRAAAMANTSITLIDIWSIYHNQAGLGYLKNMTVAAFHQSGYIKEQNLQGIAFALPTKTGTIGASYSYYGFSEYNEMQAGLAFGRSFSKYFSVGLQLNYLHTQIAGNYGSASSVNFEIGILSQPIENLFIGAHVYNPSRSKLGDEEIPTIFNLGVSYLFSDKVLFAVGTEKDLNQDAIFKAGFDYKLIDFVSLQAGISTNPAQYSFGVGFH
ncbi:MAG: hypothetical protein KOO66_08560, partial [Bacteroidales bacterium]|nr:hypothetical protein [Bacteroidales bacterium]